MKFKKIFSLFFVVSFCLNIIPLSVRAESGKWNEDNIVYTKFYADNDDCNYVPNGGINRLGGIPAEDREETELLESYLISIGYILVNTDNKRVDDEDVEMLKKCRFCGSPYLNNSDPHFWNYDNYRVYVYRPVLENMQKQYKENGKVELYTQIELNASSVVIDYYYWHTIERIGTVVDAANEINNKLPPQSEENAGFVKFTTPIDCEIVLFLNDMQYYYRLYLRKGSTLVKMRSEHYKVESINSVSMEYGDELLYNGNYIVVYQQSEDDPLVVDITQAVKRDGIGNVDISGKPEYGWVYEPADIKDFDDIIVDDKQQTTTESEETVYKGEKSKWHFPFILVGIFAVIGGVVWYYFRKKE